VHSAASSCEARRVDRDTSMAHLAKDGARMAELARADLTVAVPTCPGWTLKDLIEHCGFVHRWQTAVMRDNCESFPDRAVWEHGPRDHESWADWFQAGVDEAVAVLGAADPAASRWTWFAPDQTAGWYHVRTPQETSVHRVDAELAATGTAHPIDPDFAVQGIVELFEVMVPSSGPVPVGGTGERLLLQPSDHDSRWLVTLEAETITTVPGSGEAATTVTGAASDLLLYLWGRAPLGRIDVRGDVAVSDRLFAAFAYDED
jgi:uncharacterized protein (TIGR03083 family)